MRAPPGWWRTVWLLLVAVRRRAVGRRQRQRELTYSRARRRTLAAGALGSAVSFIFAAVLSAAATYVVQGSVKIGQQIAIERDGRMAVDGWFIERVAEAEGKGGATGAWPHFGETSLQDAYRREAASLAGMDATRRAAMRSRLQAAFSRRGAAAFVPREQAIPGLGGSAPSGLAGMLGSLALLTWFAGLVFSGEGLELDVQRRRHPMWEFLFSHPVRPGAVLMAEMLAPVAANPIYWTAPVVPGVLYGLVYGAGYGLLAAVLVGIPAMLAAACLGKAVEVAVTLRAAVRSRGAMIGIMTWLGSTALTGMLLLAATLDTALRALAGALMPLAALPWPWLGWFLGLQAEPSFWRGVASCLVASALVVASAVALSLWGTARGLAGKTGANDAAPMRQARFHGRHALYRKELAWFARDRSALVQVILVPATLGGLQLFNMRGLLTGAGSGWNASCAAGILLGSYFLAIIGPKSLASEGDTLWLAMTWPRGLESLLRAKARLWAGLASVPAGLTMAYAAWSFPADWWEIALVALLWLVFADSMARKAVTLAQVTRESGETEKVPAGRRWAVQLGTFSFAVGVLTRQPGPAIAGVVFSIVTAAAMWQNFRARLPFLLDPWSERLPPAPTLMHAMVAISLLVELGAVLNGALVAILGTDTAGISFVISYGFAAIGVLLGVGWFLRRRGVGLSQMWRWRPPDPGRPGGWWPSLRPDLAALPVGILLGLGLGGLACCYLAALEHLPWAAEAIRHARAGGPTPFFVAAVLLAPAAEEFLFRGLLFRVLDREWGGWRAVVVSAMFFAIYHPVLSWLPVGLTGAACAILFKRTGRLAASVALHTIYNAVVLGWQLFA